MLSVPVVGAVYLLGGLFDFRGNPYSLTAYVGGVVTATFGYLVGSLLEDRMR